MLLFMFQVLSSQEEGKGGGGVAVPLYTGKITCKHRLMSVHSDELVGLVTNSTIRNSY